VTTTSSTPSSILSTKTASTSTKKSPRHPASFLPTSKQEANLAKHQIPIDELEKQLAQIVAQANPAFQEWKSRLTPESPLIMADQTALVDFNKSNKKPLESRIQAKDAKPISILLKTPNYVEGSLRRLLHTRMGLGLPKFLVYRLRKLPPRQ